MFLSINLPWASLRFFEPEGDEMRPAASAENTPSQRTLNPVMSRVPSVALIRAERFTGGSPAALG